MNHNYSRIVRTLSWAAMTAEIAVTSHLFAPPALANCAGSVGSVEYWQAPMQRYWQELQQQTDYPWGQARPYGDILGDRITLTADFDRMTGTQKQQVLNLLLNADWARVVTPEEQTAVGAGPLPYRIYASDGRLLSAAYDGCTRFTTLTEQARYSWYYNDIGRSLPANSDREALRNAGRPSWRQVRFPIAASQERNVRLRFWNTVGYNQAAYGYGQAVNSWWIAWVPEQGYFEINVPPGYDTRRLRRFREIAPSQYRYIVVATDGTLVGE